MPPSRTTVGPLRSWVNVPHHLVSSTPTPPRLASLVSGPPPSSLKTGLRATKKRVAFFRSSSTPSNSPSPQSRVGTLIPSSLKKGLRATKKSVSFVRSPSSPYISTSTSTRPRFVLPGESSPRKGSRLLEGTTTFIPHRLDLTNISPTRQAAFFTALKAARDLIDNPPSSPSHQTISVRSPSPSPPVHSALPILQASLPVVAQSPSPSPVAHRSSSSPRPCQSDFFAALKVVQDLIDNPPPPLSASPIVNGRPSAPVVGQSAAPASTAATPIVASPVVALPVVVAPPCTPKRPIRKVFIPVPRPVVPAPVASTNPPKALPLQASFGAAWVASRLAPKSEFVSADEDRRDRIRVLKWAADLPTPVIDTQPVPNAIHELPISPLSSSFFRSSLGVPSPSSTPTPSTIQFSSSKGSFACSSGYPSRSPSTPERPSGFLDWWFDSLSPIIIEDTPSVPRFLENFSPVASSLFRSSFGAPEESPLHNRVAPRSRSSCPASSRSNTPSPCAHGRRPRTCIAGPDFSPPTSPRHFGILVLPSSQPPYARSPPTSSRSPVPSKLSWKSVAGFATIAAGAFTLGYLAARHLF